MKRVILASASPRRVELLLGCGFEVIVCPSNAEENYDRDTPPDEVVTLLSARKAEEVAKKYPDEFVIAADTIVVSDNKILEKPIDRNDAFLMISTLSGKTHSVYTGVCIMHKGEQRSFYDKSDVSFYELSADTIERYLDVANYSDKAGAYAVDEEAMMFIRRIEGSFATVKGLPVSRLIRELQSFALQFSEEYRFTSIF